MYKKGKNWVVASILVFAGGAGIINSTTTILAASTNNTQIESKGSDKAADSTVADKIVNTTLVVKSNLGDVTVNVSGEKGTTQKVEVKGRDGYTTKVIKQDSNSVQTLSSSNNPEIDVQIDKDGHVSTTDTIQFEKVPGTVNDHDKTPKQIVTGNLTVHSNLGDQILYNISGEAGTTIQVTVPDVDGLSASKQVTATFNKDGSITTKDSVTYGLQWIGNKQVVKQGKVGTSTAYICSNGTMYVGEGTIDTQKFRTFVDDANVNLINVDFSFAKGEVIAPNDISNLFSSQTPHLTSVNLKNLNTSNTTNFNNLFSSTNEDDDSNILDLDLSGLDMTKAKSTKNMINTAVTTITMGNKTKLFNDSFQLQDDGVKWANIGKGNVIKPEGKISFEVNDEGKSNINSIYDGTGKNGTEKFVRTTLGLMTSGNLKIKTNLGVKQVQGVYIRQGETTQVDVPHVDGYTSDTAFVTAYIDSDGNLTTEDEVTYTPSELTLSIPVQFDGKHVGDLHVMPLADEDMQALKRGETVLTGFSSIHGVKAPNGTNVSFGLKTNLVSVKLENGKL